MLEKRNAILTKISNIISEAVVDRVKTGKINDSLITDITNAISNLSPEEREIVLKNIIKTVAQTSVSGGSRSTSRNRDNEDYFSDIFGSRRR